MKPTARHVREYRMLKEIVENAGFFAEIGPFGYNDGIGFRAERDGEPSRFFWVGYRERGVILYLSHPEAIYRIADGGRVPDLCLTLLGRMRQVPGAPNVDQTLKLGYGIAAIPSMEWHAQENKERAHRLSEMGWWPLSAQEEDDVFNRVSALFFRDRGGPNWVREPAGSLTWDTSPAYAGGGLAQHLCDEIALMILRAFRRCTRPGELLYAFEYQGPIMSFDPRADVTCTTRDCLPVPILPDGDSTFFVARDFRLGLLAPYPRKVICTFGCELIGALGDDWPPRPISLLSAGQEKGT